MNSVDFRWHGEEFTATYHEDGDTAVRVAIYHGDAEVPQPYLSLKEAAQQAAQDDLTARRQSQDSDWDCSR